VWKRECFGWEYKGKRKDLNAAFVQLQQYALALENPPLLVVCDLNRFEIYTNWTNSVSEVHLGMDKAELEVGFGDFEHLAASRFAFSARFEICRGRSDCRQGQRSK
jgi:hypothetical protein